MQTARLIPNLIVVLLSATLVTVSAQTPVTEVNVGMVTNPPTIDGQWQQGEWDNTVEYNLTIGSSQVRNRPSIRLLHDNGTLFGLIDVPSDTGGSYMDSTGHQSYGNVLILLANQNTKIGCIVSLNIVILLNQTQRVQPPEPCRQTAPMTQSRAASQLTTTIHSNIKHRVWEFASQLYPNFVSGPLTNNNALTVNFAVVDSAGNAMDLANSGSQSGLAPVKMSFVTTPVPETNDAVVMVSSSLLISLLLLSRRRKRSR